MSSTGQATSPTKDDLYYLETIVFQVENRLFSVPKHHFAQSEGIFGTTFTLQPEAGVPTDGSSADQPLILTGILAEEFRAFLKVLYPLVVPVDYESIPFEEWVMIIKLSTMWDFDHVRSLAIRQMTRSPILSPLNKIILGRTYNVRQWLKDGCISFFNRHQGVTQEEGEKLGLATTIRIYQLREEGMQRRPQFMTEAAVERVFRDELGPPESGEQPLIL